MLYNKLVRDRIPEIIERDGLVARTRTISGDELRQALHAKLREEVREFEEAPSPEELADVLEVLRAASKVYGIDWADVESTRMAKGAERGGFDLGIFLIETVEDPEAA